MQAVLKKLIVENFRNLSSLEISFEEKINCIFGNNGNGKTNILEALFYIINRKSFRKNSSFPQFLNYDFDENYFSIQSLFSLNNNLESFSLKSCSVKENYYSHNGKPSKSKINIKTIFINPFDAYEFFNTPKKRREWFDDHLGKLDPSYKKFLSRYNQSIRQKNILLQKKTSNYKEQVKALNVELAENIVIIGEKRLFFLDELKKYYFDTFKEIFDIECEMNILIQPSIEQKNSKFVLEFLNNLIEKEAIVGKSLYGVHKDNYLIFFNGLNAVDYCSVGQQKMTYFSLIFAYIQLFRYKCTTFPMILMDDISGELDDTRWDRLIAYLDSLNLQVILTTANVKFKEKLINQTRVNLLHIENGMVKNL